MANNNYVVHPPGTILQHMYLRNRLSRIAPGKFIEIGVGRGYISELLLSMGWQGVGYELNPNSVAFATGVNKSSVENGHYQLLNHDWLSIPSVDKVDLIISCMVVEHLGDEDERKYFNKCAEVLNKEGMAILLLPASMKHWGIEDEIAGHYRRYTFQMLTEKAKIFKCNINHIAGLTYPLSNVLLPISNYLVKKAEFNKVELSMNEKTQKSGFRKVKFKTSFPPLLRLVLNKYVLLPFYWLQIVNSKNESSLVIYTELSFKK